MSEIKFGTDGWRAIIDKDFTDINVTRASYAIAKYITSIFMQTQEALHKIKQFVHYARKIS